MISDGQGEHPDGSAPANDPPRRDIDARPSQRETVTPSSAAPHAVKVTPSPTGQILPAFIEHVARQEQDARSASVEASPSAHAEGVAPASEPSRWLEPGGWPRWYAIAGFWILQSLLILVIWPIVFIFSWRGDWSFVADFIENFGDRDFWAIALPSVVVITLAQTVFVWPVRRPGLRASGVSARLSLIVAGLCSVLLAVALFMALREIPWLIEQYVAQSPRKSSQSAVPAPLSMPFFVTIAIGWIIVTPLLFAFVRGPLRERRLGRLAAILFTGTIVEVAAIIPIDVLVRKKSSCYCEQGSFWALTICGGVGTVFLGPAIWLPLLAKRRKRWYAGHCDACGYDMRGCMNAERCPECGCGWKPAA